MTVPPPPPQQPQQPPTPYPAPPQAPGYPQAQAPGYPQAQAPGYPQPQGWGPQPPRDKRLGAGGIIAIVVASLLGVTALGGVARYLTSHGHDSSQDERPAPASAEAPRGSGGSEPPGRAEPSPRRYRLTVPGTLLGGRYTLTKDVSRTIDDGIAGQRNSVNERNMKGVGGQYTADGGEQELVTGGLYGEIANPRRTLDSMFQGMNGNPGVTVTTPPKDITPPGAREPVTCERYSVTRPGGSGFVAVCGWGDHSTVATVSLPGPDDRADLEALAKQTAEVRDEMRVPAGS
ncbi:hypothetical protein ABZ419_09365 [Streptomyces cinnamoneus]|uniref:hypothetical protein n=1 Tax=Streptomyces cinnamoneus TaxID=53446 RepID=UPI0033ED6817